MENENTKICIKCGKEKDKLEFYKNKRNKDGLEGKCIVCKKAYQEENKEKIATFYKKYRESHKEELAKENKAWREENKDKIKKQKQIYYEENREEILIKAKEKRENFTEKEKKELAEYQKEYHEENKEKLSQQSKEYRKQNKRKILDRNNEYIKNKRKNNPAFRYMLAVSTQIRIMLKEQGFFKNGVSYKKKLPFTGEELWKHLESQFSDPENLTPDGKVWMTKDNYGIYNGELWDDSDSSTWTWNIDHIIPQSKLKFDNYNHPNFLKCWSLENLRPLSAKKNVEMGSKLRWLKNNKG